MVAGACCAIGPSGAYPAHPCIDSRIPHGEKRNGNTGARSCRACGPSAHIPEHACQPPCIDSRIPREERDGNMGGLEM
eukprot:1651972-Prymnesium_polylepis.1